MSKTSLDRNPVSNSPPVLSEIDLYPFRITTIHLNGDNFLHWSRSVCLYIRGRGKISYLTGEAQEPAKTDPAHMTWDAENATVMMWLINSMEEDIGSNYMFYSTAKEIWDNVKLTYSDSGNNARLYKLALKLNDIRQGNDTVTKYFNSLQSVWHEIDFYNDDRTVVEADRVFKFLMGLNKEFIEVRRRIIGTNPLPSVDEVFCEVRREENRRFIMFNETRTGRNGYNHREKDEKSRVQCDYCNKTRHTRETCWEIHGKPGDRKGKHKRGHRTSNGMGIRHFRKEQIDERLKIMKSSNPTVDHTPDSSIIYTELELGDDDWRC